MPSPADFRRAFQLSKGSTLGEKGMFTIVASHLGHEVKVRRSWGGAPLRGAAHPPPALACIPPAVACMPQEQNESYDFPTTLEVECAAGTAAVGAARLERVPVPAAVDGATALRNNAAPAGKGHVPMLPWRCDTSFATSATICPPCSALDSCERHLARSASTATLSIVHTG